METRLRYDGVPRFRSSPVSLAGMATLLLALGVAAAADIRAVPPAPQGRILVARPLLEWRVQAESPVAGGEFTVDEAVVRAIWEPRIGRLRGELDAPLAVGVHRATVTATLADGKRLRQEWRFEVAPGSAAMLPVQGERERQALAAANRYRAELGLPEFELDPRLSAAAAAHAAYLVRNNARGHFQDPALPGFVGVRPSQRYAAFGVPAVPSTENVVTGAVRVEDVVRRTFDPPYHRMTFFDPGAPQLGFGAVEKGRELTGVITLTGDPFAPRAERIVYYPPDGGRDIPTAFHGGEAPDCLRLHDARYPVGYVVTVAVVGGAEPRLRVNSASLTTGGQEVPSFLTHPGNDDELGGAALLLIPRRPLRAGTTYTVRVDAVTDSGPVKHSWSFTTGRDTGRR
jgi:uncharacterized protein YkwD